MLVASPKGCGSCTGENISFLDLLLSSPYRVFRFVFFKFLSSFSKGLFLEEVDTELSLSSSSFKLSSCSVFPSTD